MSDRAFCVGFVCGLCRFERGKGLEFELNLFVGLNLELEF